MWGGRGAGGDETAVGDKVCVVSNPAICKIECKPTLLEAHIWLLEGGHKLKLEPIKVHLKLLIIIFQPSHLMIIT